MTFERTEILQSTINKLLAQTYPPEKILVVDNSLTTTTKEYFENNKSEQVEYYYMGYNSGPAGAAAFALQYLSDLGFGWIFWGDDDDPPKENRTFENLIKLATHYDNVGIMGSLGGKFIESNARTRGFYNKELNGIVDADFVAGNKMMIVNSEVVKRNILPTKKLFFGFEELDFCLRVKDAGFRIIFDGEKIKESRKMDGNVALNYKWKGNSFGNIEMLWRNYYSTRNMLYILKSRKIYDGYIFFLFKSIIKIPLAYKYGLNYGFSATKVYVKSIWHHLKGTYGFHKN
jgi:glycosyltransferase involved in cell wall biosynthesis